MVNRSVVLPAYNTAREEMFW